MIKYFVSKQGEILAVSKDMKIICTYLREHDYEHIEVYRLHNEKTERIAKGSSKRVIDDLLLKREFFEEQDSFDLSHETVRK